jgi:hypothetical protein
VPHIVLEGLDVARCSALQVPFTVREGERLVKVERLYVDAAGQAALLETIVVDRGHPQKFFIQVGARAGGATVRLEPLTDPEKTDAVKRALAIVAHRIREATGCRYGSSNIAEFLVAADAAAGEP